MFKFSGLHRSLLSHALRQGQQGATAVEYSLMIGLITVVIVVSVTALGLGVLGLFTPLLPGL